MFHMSSDNNERFIVNNDKLIKLANDVSDAQLSIEASQEMIEEKIKKLKRELIKKNKATWDIMRK